MSQQNKQASSYTQADHLPVKRKRGRPRKDENLVHKEKAQPPAPPQCGDLKAIQHVDLSDDIDDDMVGQVVSGVIEGSFDAGYFLSVRAGNTDTLLRGMVFQPGLFTPITAANDVAPQAKRYTRREFPIPFFNPQCPVNGSMPPLEQKNEQPVQLESQAPMVPNQVLHSELLSSSTFATPTSTRPKNEPGAALGGKNMPQHNSKFGLENQSGSQWQSGAQISFPNQSASVTLPETVTANFIKNDSDVSLGGKYMAQKNFESGLENLSVPQSQSGYRFELADQSASVMIPLTNTLPKNVAGASLEGKATPQQNSEFRLENKSTPFALAKQAGSFAVSLNNTLFNNDSSGSLGGNNMSQLKFEFGVEKQSTPQFERNRIVEHDRMMQEFEASTMAGEPKLDVKGTNDVMLELASEMTADIFPGNEAVTRVQPQALDSAFEPSELAHDGLKSPDHLELHQTLIAAEPRLVTGVPISDPMNTLTENPLSLKTDMPQTIQLELAKNPSRDEISGSTFSDVADRTKGVFTACTNEEPTGNDCGKSSPI